MKLKHTAQYHVRSFSEEDFTRHGVEDQEAVEFNQDNNHIVEVSDAAAEFLMQEFPDEFREATEEDEETVDLTRTNAPQHFTQPGTEQPDSELEVELQEEDTGEEVEDDGEGDDEGKASGRSSRR